MCSILVVGIPSTNLYLDCDIFFLYLIILVVSIYQNSKSCLVVYMHSKTEHESQKTNSFLTCYGALKECVCSKCVFKKENVFNMYF